MACFIVPTAEAVVTTAIKKSVDKNGQSKNPFVKKLGWLNNMLWGGSALLAFEHVWHGEVTPFFPFLTAAADSGEAMEMLREMATSGVGMAVLVTAVWAVMVCAAARIEKRPAAEKVKGDAKR